MSGFVATGQENDDLHAAYGVIHPIALSVGDAQFADTFANGLVIAEISIFGTVDTSLNPNSRLAVPQLGEPSIECRCR